MNKIISALFILLIGNCKAATGNASDGPLITIVVFILLLLILGTGYLIDLMKNKLKEFRQKKLMKKNYSDPDDEFLNSFKKTIPELDGMPAL
jgi:hypothetical protein